MQLTKSTVLLAIIGASALSACEKKAASTADSVTAQPSTAADAAPAALTDANIVYILDGANVADSARGALAATKGTSADVRSFGTMMQGEHHALRVEGAAVAATLALSPTAPTGDMSAADATAELDKLNAEAKGAGWDRSYIDFEVSYHQSVLATANSALAATSTQALKDLIAKAAPVIQKHLDRAIEIQGKLPH